jgi:hypothetical protein
MATSGGPNLVKSGLVLSYDAANIKSFRGDPTTNTISFSSPGVARYNNPSFSGAITNTGLTYKGSPIWEVTFIPQNETFIPRLGSTEGFGFLHSMGTSLLGNTPYIASVYFKTDFPLVSTNTQGFSHGYSNISGWNSSGTSATRYEEDGWTRLWTRFLNNITIGGIGYAFRNNTSQNTVTVNTTTTTDITVTLNLLSNATMTSTTNINTSSAAGFSNADTLVGFYAASPTIISTNITGMSTGTSTIINHGTETTNWTKMSASNPLPRSNFPTQYYVQIRVPSTGGVNQTFVLRPNLSGYYTAISDSKYWKVTFNTTNLQVGQVIRTYWAAPMIEQRSIISPTNFVIGTRGTTVATGGGVIDTSKSGNNAEVIGPHYDNSNNGILIFDGTDDQLLIQYSSSLDVINYTYSFWIKRVVGQSSSFLQFLQRSTSNRNPGIWFYSNEINRIHFSIRLQNGSQGDVNPSGFLQNEWKYFTATVQWTGTQTIIRGYTNGILTSSSTHNSSPIAGTGTSYIGKQLMEIANLQIYNRALSDDEVLQNFNSTRGRFRV